jgi:hypothetical protein
MAGVQHVLPLEKILMPRNRLLFALVIVAAVSRPMSGAPPKFDYFVVGNPADAVATTTAGYVLMGGGTDVDEAFRWMSSRALAAISWSSAQQAPTDITSMCTISGSSIQ